VLRITIANSLGCCEEEENGEIEAIDVVNMEGKIGAIIVLSHLYHAIIYYTEKNLRLGYLDLVGQIRPHRLTMLRNILVLPRPRFWR
jgi:hypothetical protein